MVLSTLSSPQNQAHLQTPPSSFAQVSHGTTATKMVSSSSFESPQRHNYPPSQNPPFLYPHGSPIFDGAHHSNGFKHWPVSHHPVSCVTDVNPNDVLSGRGGATNCHLGNQSFRQLVKQYQGMYLKAKKSDKLDVAAIVVEKIRETGGRFLRRYKPKGDTTERLDPKKLDHIHDYTWIDIGDAKAREKACQALRENAPAIKKAKTVSSATAIATTAAISSSSDSDGGSSFQSTIICDVSSPASSLTTKGNYNPCSTVGNNTTRMVRTSYELEKEEAEDATAYQGIGMPLFIRPCMSLIGLYHPGHQDVEISVDSLNKNEREMYLRDFLPPSHNIPTYTNHFNTTSSSFNNPQQQHASSAWDMTREDIDSHLCTPPKHVAEV